MLTTHQNEVAEQILTSLKSSKGPNEIILKGYAGTGKTFLTKYITQHLGVPYYVTAPIHKAVRVISAVTNAKGLTMHSFHGLRLNINLEDFDITNPQYDPLGFPKYESCKVLICDEASQNPKQIYNLTLAMAKKHGFKVLYIGDHGQLPPVKERQSKVFDIKDSYTLNEIIRQEENNNLLKLFKYIRSDLDNNTSDALRYLLKHTEQMEGNTGYRVLNTADYSKAIEDQFTNENLKNANHIRNISFTNGNVNTWNTYIRGHMLGRDIPLVTDKDLFTSYCTIVDEFNDVVISNSTDYAVYQFRDYVDDFGLKTFAVNFIEPGAVFPTKTLQIVDHTDEKTLKSYKNILFHLYRNAITSDSTNRGKNWRKYFAFKDMHLCMIDITLYFNGEKIKIKKSIDYAYGLTAHKAQGSTYKHVSVDLQDIIYYYKNGKYNSYTDVSLRNKLLYVALSRAQESAIIRYLVK